MKKSFTLIEVLVAMTVFIIGIAPLLGVLTSVTLNHVEYKNESKVDKLLKYKAREIMDSNESAFPYDSHKNRYTKEIKNVVYSIYVDNISEGSQQIRIIAGTSANLQITHGDHEAFIDPDLGNDDRIEGRYYFTHTYPIY